MRLQQIDRLRPIVGLVLCAGSLAIAPSVVSAASDSTREQYENAVAQINSDVKRWGGSHSQDAAAEGLQGRFVSQLPFTGLDLVALLTVVSALISVGFALRWLSNGQGRYS